MAAIVSHGVEKRRGERGYNNHDLLRGMRARMSSGIVKIAEEEEGGGIYPHPGRTNCALACADRNSAIWGWRGQLSRVPPHSSQKKPKSTALNFSEH